MIRWYVGVVMFLVVAGEASAQKGNWLTNYDAAKAAARRSGKPIFLVFR